MDKGSLGETCDSILSMAWKPVSFPGAFSHQPWWHSSVASAVYSIERVPVVNELYSAHLNFCNNPNNHT